MRQRKTHILFEHGVDLRPYGSAHIRLLRPLKYPPHSNNLQATAGLDYEGQVVNAVVVDRLWRPDISLKRAEELVEKVRGAGARLIYALDDNFLDLPARRFSSGSQPVWPTEEHRQVVRLFLSEAHGVIVTTPALKVQLASLNSKIQVVPNALDERLLIPASPPPPDTPFGRRRKVIGYMGTLTHDDDLKMILPVWQAVWERHREEIEFQIVGVVGDAETMTMSKEFPIRFVSPRPDEGEYPLFMLWFTSRLAWDIAVSPLQDSPFTLSKSDIKFLDYSAMGAAGVYSRVPAYATVRHLETGWLVENQVDAWVEALETLLSDDSLRSQIAKNATYYLHAERTLARCAQVWWEAIENFLEDR